MSISKAALAFFLCISSANLSLAEHFTYGDVEVAGRHDERFKGRNCRITVNGPSGGSYVAGTYDDPDGELRLLVDGHSYLEVRGTARKVVVMFVDRNSNLNLTHLKVGSGGVEIHSVNRQSKVNVGECEGTVTINSAESSSITLRPGTHVIGRDRLRDDAHLFFEKPAN